MLLGETKTIKAYTLLAHVVVVQKAIIVQCCYGNASLLQTMDLFEMSCTYI